MAELTLHLEADSYPASAIELIEGCGDLHSELVTSENDALVALSLRPYTAVFVGLGLPVGISWLEAAPTLKWVVSPTTGLNHVDVDGLQAGGVRVISLQDSKDRISEVWATAEHTWALLLALVRQVPDAHASVLKGDWRRERFLGTELAGKTLGVIGYGRLGRRVASYGRSFGMSVLYYDIDPAARASAHPDDVFADPDRLLRSSDVVSLHLSYSERTQGWLSRERIEVLTPGAFIINTARGELLDEEALAEALIDNRIGGAALDVLDGDSTWEGSTGSSPLVAAARSGANIILTPHIGGWSRDAVSTTRQIAAESFAIAVHSTR